MKELDIVNMQKMVIIVMLSLEIGEMALVKICVMLIKITLIMEIIIVKLVNQENIVII